MSEGTFIVPFIPRLQLVFTVTPVSLLLSVMVFIAVFFILLYSMGYMQKERGKMRFFAFMLLFITGMQLFIFAGDWLLLLTAWEIISVASYFLIGFYRTDTAIKAGNRAFITTRSADTGLLLGILLLFSLTQTTEIARTVSATGIPAQLAALFILIAGFAKAAQVPFDGWLRDAMAGPTPVSALLHSATLVAAGVILILRIFPLFTPPLLLLIGIIGGITALITGITAITQHDLKRMLAASTSAQLGLMFLSIGSGIPGAALLHLVANAAMKGSLFLSAGIFHHKRENTEFQKLRGVGKKELFVFSAFVIAGLALSGIPPLAGFFTKDAIIASTISSPFRAIFLPMALLASVFTGVYIARSVKLIWNGSDEDQSDTTSVLHQLSFPRTRESMDPRVKPEDDKKCSINVKNRPLSGKYFMYTGLAGLLFFILMFFLLFKPLEGLVGFEAIEGNLPLLLGLAVGITGLVAGWVWKENFVPKNLTTSLQNGLSISVTLDSLVIKATIFIASRLVSIEELLVALPQKTAAGALGVSRGMTLVDFLLTQQVFGIGRMNLTFSNFSNQSGEPFINSIINYLVTEVRTLGTYARRLQTGLIHQEMAYALYGTLFVIVFYLLFTIML